MPACAAFGCRKRHIPGTDISFFRFPKNPILRKAWKHATRRKNFESKGCQVLCSLHFNETDIIPAKRGRRKYLRKGALPVTSSRKPRQTKNSLKSITPPPCATNVLKPLSHWVLLDHAYSLKKVNVDFTQAYKPVHYTEAGPPHITATENENPSKQKRSFASQADIWSEMEYNYAQDIRKAIHWIFNQDQILYLCSGNKVQRKWSPQTIEQALMLHKACGTTGYEMLIQQKFPLPSLRTLRRRLEQSNLVPGPPQDES